jgi:[CysO sulfur-carrier protein]-S-L-cysteine hydrolase
LVNEKFVVRILNEVIEHILIHAARVAPIEACGVLLGNGDSIIMNLALTNIDQREDHYTCDPKEQFDAMKIAKQLGVDIVASYHSHPATPAWPSVEDIRLALDPSLLYVIVSLFENTPVIKAFKIMKGEVEEVTLHVENDTP